MRWRSRSGADSSRHSRGAPCARLPCAVVVAGTAFLSGLHPAAPAAAQEAYQRLDQMHHTTWTAEDGLTGSATSLAQTSDGFLWVGTSDGLFRFDGVRFEAYGPERGAMEAVAVSTLAASPDGGLWVGHTHGGVSFLAPDGSATGYSAADSIPVGDVRGIAVDHDGAVWLAAVGGLARFEAGRWKKVRMEWNYASLTAWNVFVEPDGTLWVGGASPDRIHFLPRGAASFIELDAEGSATGFASLDDSTVVYVSSDYNAGTVHVARRRAGGAAVVEVASGYGANRVAVDGRGLVWIAGSGVTRLRVPDFAPGSGSRSGAADVEEFSRSDGRSTLPAKDVLVDREGTVWVATDSGLDRFRHRNLTWVRDPLEPVEASLVTDGAGEAWLLTFGPTALRRARDFAPVPDPPVDLENGFLDHEGNVWILTHRGLVRWAGGRFHEIPPPKEIVDRGFPFGVIAATRERSGRFWASVNGSGVFVLEDSVWTLREILAGRPDWAPIAAEADAEDRVWLAYRDELAMIRGGETRIFSPGDGLEGPLTTVRAHGGTIWVGSETGLALLRDDRFHPVEVASGSALGSVTAIVPTGDGLWLTGSAGIVHLPREEVARLVGDATYRVRPEVFGLESDLPDPLKVGLSARVFVRGTEDGEGVLWFVTRHGLARLDPREIVRNPLPPPVAFRSVTADDRTYSTHGEIVLPPLTRTLRIEYAALSLVMPERVEVRHRLEGWEDGWHEAGGRREVTYTDLRPGRYTLRVTASNNDGVWNGTGAELAFMVAPAWFQTAWFRALAVALGLAAGAGLFRLRVRQVSSALHAKFDARLAERTRIARELHDTLLQTVQGSKLVADEALASGDGERIRHAMERLSTWLGRAIDEGRGAVETLRASAETVNDLAESLCAAADGPARPPALSVSAAVRGTSRNLHPIVRDEIYRIGCEAIQNACAHSEARGLEIAIEYAHDLTLRITDDGVGIDPDVARSGRPGRFGLSGMRERAAAIGAALAVEGSSAGTCVTLVVPGRSAFRGDVRHT